jgi:hypothetical protein
MISLLLLSRLRVLFCSFVFLFSASSFAAVPMGGEVIWGSAGGCGSPDPATGGLCELAINNGHTGCSLISGSFVSATLYQGSCHDPVWGNTQYFGVYSHVNSKCPDNASPDGAGACTCNPSFVEDPTHTSCIPGAPPPPPKTCPVKDDGQYSAPYVAGEGLNSPKFTNLCSNGCAISVTYDIATGGMRYGQGRFNGSNCSVDPLSDGSASASGGSAPAPSLTVPPAPGSAAPTPCVKGEFPGTINGVQRCVKSLGADVTLAPTTVTGTSDISGAPAGSVNSTTTTICSGSGSCTTTTSYSNSAGVSTGTSSASQSRDSFCQTNPTSSACGGSGAQSGFSGACGAPPVCTGDAAICAIAAATFATNCALNNPSVVPLPVFSDRLYTPKYPDGFSGVWTQKVALMKAAPLFGLVDHLMPSVASSGSCPVWNIPLNVGFKDFGTYDVAPPCWVWDFGKIIVILSALILARALIFGG